MSSGKDFTNCSHELLEKHSHQEFEHIWCASYEKPFAMYTGVSVKRLERAQDAVAIQSDLMVPSSESQVRLSCWCGGSLEGVTACDSPAGRTEGSSSLNKTYSWRDGVNLSWWQRSSTDPGPRARLRATRDASLSDSV